MALLKITVFEANFVNGDEQSRSYMTEASEAEARAWAERMRGKPTKVGRIERVVVSVAPLTSLRQIEELNR